MKVISKTDEDGKLWWYVVDMLGKVLSGPFATELEADEDLQQMELASEPDAVEDLQQVTNQKL